MGAVKMCKQNCGAFDCITWPLGLQYDCLELLGCNQRARSLWQWHIMFREEYEFITSRVHSIKFRSKYAIACPR